MADPKALRILERLRDATRAAQVVWEPTVDEGVFQTSFEDQSLRIGRNPDPEVPAGYCLEVYNSYGRRVATICDMDFDGEARAAAGSLLHATHERAREMALGDAALDALLSRLEALPH